MEKHKNCCFESFCLSFKPLLFLYFSAFFAVWAFFTSPFLFLSISYLYLFVSNRMLFARRTVLESPRAEWSILCKRVRKCLFRSDISVFPEQSFLCIHSITRKSVFVKPKIKNVGKNTSKVFGFRVYSSFAFASAITFSATFEGASAYLRNSKVNVPLPLVMERRSIA